MDTSHNEEERILALKEYNLLDTLPENELDDLTRLASLVCKTPIALITLIDEDRQWFKANIGLNASETPRNISFCQYAIQGKEIYEVPNATANKLFSENPLVTGYPNMRFYAGAPLVNPQGYVLGTLCVIDTVPRHLDENQKETLQVLSRLIVQQFELRRKKAEMETSRTTFHKMVEEVADIIYTTGPEGNFTYVNQKVESILGYTPKELIGKNYTELIIPEWKEQVKEFYSQQFQQQKNETKMEFPVVNKWGETRWVEQSVVAIIKENMIQGFQGIVRDITDRRKYETELLETKSLLTQAMSIGRMGSFENNMVAKKITWSPEIYHMMDMSLHETPLSFEGYINSIHPEDVKAVLDRIERNTVFKQPDMYVCRHITATGHIKWMETRVVPFFDLEGNLVMVRGTMQDISEQKELEHQLIASKELAEQSVMAKEQFLANMSHEIRTPMNAVLGFADLLAESPLNEEQKEFVSAIQTSGKNLMTIINDILDYSKIEAGMMTIEETPLSVRSIFSSLNVLFGQKAREKNLGLRFVSGPEIPETVLGDSTRLTQIITNLVGNALKFTNQGHVEVHARMAEKTNEKVVVLFSVTDTGIGIDPDKLAAIFERFNQGSNSTTRQYGGTGLGLSIARKLVELQGGKLSVHSQKGLGSSFEFSIVFKPHEHHGHHETLSPVLIEKKHQGPIKILLAEDNIMNQRLAERILHNLGYEVEIAANGKVAVDKVEHNTYDLVLMDMQMPEMDGYEAAALIRKKLNQSVPIIAMTAHAMSGEKEKCLEMGMNDYIAKPFKPDHLQEKISALVVAAAQEQKNIIRLDSLYQVSKGDEDFVREILGVFVTETPVELGRLNQALEQENYGMIKTLTHKLVSSVGLVGLKDFLLPVLQEMEALGDKGQDLSRIKTLNDTLGKTCERAIQEAKEFLGK